MKDPLSRELALLGLDDTDRARLEAGAVITMDGLFISIRNGCLSTSRQRPGLRPEQNPLAGWESREFDDIEHGHAAHYRTQALQVLDQDEDLEAWLSTIPEHHQQLALDQASALVEQMEDEARWMDAAAPKYNDDDFSNWMNDLCHGSEQP